jgi:hypothetical protein
MDVNLIDGSTKCFTLDSRDTTSNNGCVMLIVRPLRRNTIDHPKMYSVGRST